jgi:alkylhydroperoxidase family enzyme
MTWIKVIDIPEANGALREAYDEVASTRGEVGNILKAHSLHPKVLSAHLHLYKELMFGRSELSRAEREIIALAVSVFNHCDY